MEVYKAKTLVIVTEISILEDVTKMVTELGAGGYTVQHASGKGRRGARWLTPLDESGGNIRIEVIASEEVAKKIASEMVERFFKTYAGIAYITGDVDVYRADGI
ncbi:hypothetical protein M1N42_04435 [Thermodesulfovibrionales bacterium]|nr:hypothetical protein [Thermodesulfovibrionales bacterium]MCL0068966.1 hypothetical protein [Thermodesulfovibrionales bacterium]MCL0083173.1 hypothetical protein [Thermodesulfovibrionales bacterium]MCL0105746.1 hypothetical protein [Thermodesulfovibrionales bacterium]